MLEGRRTAVAPKRPAEPWTHVRRVVARSGTSFLWGMRVLPAERRRAMYAIYAFCREVDDVADEPGDSAEKKRGLAAWREEVARLYGGEPRWLTTRALLQPVQRYDLPREEFLSVIDGVETDTAPAVRMGTLDDLLRYCRKVSGAVGMLSIHAFGVPRDPGYRIAETLGNAVQLTNILRDVKEDAANERLYIPLDLMRRHGVPECWSPDGSATAQFTPQNPLRPHCVTDFAPVPQAGVGIGPSAPMRRRGAPELEGPRRSRARTDPPNALRRRGAPGSPLSAVCGQPGFAASCAELAGIARDHYAGAERLLAGLGRRQVRPIVLMMAVYRETLRRLEQRGWMRVDHPVPLGRARKLWLAARYGLL